MTNFEKIKCAERAFVDELECLFDKNNQHFKYLSKDDKYNILRGKFDEHLDILLELKGFCDSMK